MNSIILIGRLTKDVELKTTTTGVSVCTFTIAVDRDYVKAGAERETDFFEIVAWRKTAEFVAAHFHKGNRIAISGTLQTRVFEKDGESRRVYEVVASGVDFCESKNVESKPAENVEADELPF